MAPKMEPRGGGRALQMRVLLRKQWLVRKRSTIENVQLFVIPVFALGVTYLFYYVFQSGRRKGESTGVLELVFVPLGLVFLQFAGVVNLVGEKSARLVETMKIMSLKADVYYAAYALEGVVAGALQALVLAAVAAALGLFNGAAFGLVFALIFVYCVATTAVSILVAAVVDHPQNASIVALAFQAACVIAFFSVPNLMDAKASKLAPATQRAWCLLPPVALEFGVNSFRGAPTQDKYTRPKVRKRWAAGCDRAADVRFAFNCPGLEARGVANEDYDLPEARWAANATFLHGGQAYAAYDMLEAGIYGPPGLDWGSEDYYDLAGGEIVVQGAVGDCEIVAGATYADCVDHCAAAAPEWAAINVYAYDGGGGDDDDDDDDDDGDAAGLACCCQTPAADSCSRPSSGGLGAVVVREAAVLPARFCADGGVVQSGTYKKKKKYTQYDALALESILEMMVVSMVVSCVLAWYLSQVVPSEFGVRKPWYFPLFAFRGAAARGDDGDARGAGKGDEEDGACVVEADHRGDAATVRIAGLRKVFGHHVAVDDLRFDLYASEIFSLLGHNGAGKTTAINVLTGVLESDSREADGGATIFGHPVRGAMDDCRAVTGVCPQHDVLFERLTTREHLTFFATLKGSAALAAGAEADELLATFHLRERGGHLGHELSGGMRRKLSSAVALCGGSKFVLLDEPTAGMDALARRELWDLLATAKKGRTLLLTTHYMDEADVLGDRVGIMSHGALKCVGTSRFLKQHYGAGYRVVCERAPGSDEAALERFDALLAGALPGARRAATLVKRKTPEPTFEATLPLEALPRFAAFFKSLDANLGELRIASYGLTITSLEEVFLAVGADATVAPKKASDGDIAIGTGRKYAASFPVQVMGLAKKRLDAAPNDAKILSLVFLPFAACVAAFALCKAGAISKTRSTQDLASCGIAAGGWLLVPPLLAEQIVRERETKLRDVLSVMGCDFRAYWLGTFLGDMTLLSVVWALGYWIFVPALGIPGGGDRRVDAYLTDGGIFWFPPVLTTELVLYSYALSMVFSRSKRCLTFGMGLQILQVYFGVFLVLIISLIPGTIPDRKINGTSWWFMPIFSPQGAFFLGLYSIPQKLPAHGPREAWQFLLLLAVMATLYALVVYGREKLRDRPVAVVFPDETVAADAGGDVDVVAERDAVEAMPPPTKGGPYTLVARRLRKVYPPKGAKVDETVAVHDCSFRVARGECFGLLGANGAGKSTTMDMIIRATPATAGDAFVDGFSTMTHFHLAAEALGVVAQGNTLWDKLSCEDHLALFARIRGVPGDAATALVEAALDQLELRPHATKLAQRLSGGMKRKLCVAIAIVGDPECVLLDEPSAGLDPVSRRNLWNVIRATMDARSCVLTSHLMEEVEALCDRVGIMVRGKLRCLGTIQHLKHSLGKHYEVELAVDPEAFARDPDGAATKLRAFAGDVFGAGATEEGAPSAGLFTYHVPQAAMRIGACFEAIEAKRDAVGLVDYSIAQPSLEAVFIRTVLDHSGDERPASMRSLRSRNDLSFDEEVGMDESPGGAHAESDKCTGCSRRTHWKMAAACWPLCVVCVLLSYFLPAIGIFAVVFLVAAVWGSIACCCRLKKEENVAKTCGCCLP